MWTRLRRSAVALAAIAIALGAAGCVDAAPAPSGTPDPMPTPVYIPPTPEEEAQEVYQNMLIELDRMLHEHDTDTSVLSRYVSEEFAAEAAESVQFFIDNDISVTGNVELASFEPLELASPTLVIAQACTDASARIATYPNGERYRPDIEPLVGWRLTFERESDDDDFVLTELAILETACSA